MGLASARALRPEWALLQDGGGGEAESAGHGGGVGKAEAGFIPRCAGLGELGLFPE